jgi:aspartate/methionine/tyrosine aminotransferase
MRHSSQSVNLPEIECIEMLEDIEDSYAKRFGAAPFNISHWDSSSEFEKEMLGHLDMPALDSVTSYRFSYQITEPDPVIIKLGGVARLHRGLFTPSTTTSILCVLNWLKSQHKERIFVMCPSYFSLTHACRRFGLALSRAYLKRKNGGFTLPQADSSIWREPSVLWITNPVYGAGVYLSSADILFIGDLLKSGWTVVADECLALLGKELIRTLGEHKNFVSIYSPHKSVCVNGIKFSVVLFNRKHLKFMERWADVWYGGLGCSSSLAIIHFLSANFDSYQSSFLQSIARQRKIVDQLGRKPFVETDAEAKGHFVSYYFPALSSRLGNSRLFLEKLVNSTGGSVISGNRSRFDRECGFSFRVNLARSGPRFRPTLARIIEQVTSCAD